MWLAVPLEETAARLGLEMSGEAAVAGRLFLEAYGGMLDAFDLVDNGFDPPARPSG